MAWLQCVPMAAVAPREHRAPASLLTTASARSASVVEAVLDRVAIDGERSFGAVRVVALVLIAAVWTIATFAELLVGGATAWLVLTICGVGLVMATTLQVLLRRMTKGSRRLSLWSVLLDMALCVALLLGIVVYPPTDYIGILHVTGLSIVAVAVAGAGLRLSRTNAIIAGVVGVVGVGGAFALDQHRNAAIIQESALHLAIAVVLVTTAGLVAWTMAHRTRTVALQTAQQALMAERARAHLGAYVSEEVAALSLQHDELSLSVGARVRAATAIMVRDLNEYFQAMVAAISTHHGVVDKYIGDSIMAVFGVPNSRGDDAAHVLAAARAMEAALVQLNERRQHRGAPPLQHGIGVHLGDVVAGNIGTSARTQYTVIGDAVSVAARLESETKKQGVTVLASEDVVVAAGAAGMDGLVRTGADEGVVVKGRAQPIKVYTLQVAA